MSEEFIHSTWTWLSTELEKRKDFYRSMGEKTKVWQLDVIVIRDYNIYQMRIQEE
jgi:hypothetical protein